MSRLTKKCGTEVQLCVVRSAMMRPSDVATSIFSDFCEVALDLDGELAAASMSEARISPPVPEPVTPEISTPSSLARRRALGEILAADAVGCAAVAGSGTAWGCSV